jgi:uncharacterized protein YfaS (alpha-2-macroglobulin family)
MKTRILLMLAMASLLFSSVAMAAESRVTAFTPQGVVKGVRQVKVRFSEQMVSFGDPRAEDPFSVNCPKEGKGRWIDGQNWVYDFKTDLPGGVRCRFTLKPGLKTLSGRPVKGRRVFSFSTGGPSVKRSYPYEGTTIDEHQIFVLTLDAAANEDSVIEHVWCSVDEIHDRIPIRILKGSERDRILKAYSGRRYPWHKGMPELVCQCKQRFPNNRAVRLVWGKGIISQTGVATGRDQVLQFKSRGPFRATFQCSRENPEAACIPFKPMRLGFTAPVPWKYASKIRLRGPAGAIAPQKPDSRRESVYQVNFPGPFSQTTTFRMELPPELRDDAGRGLSNRHKFPLTVKTAPYPPLAKFSARFGIIEESDPILPVTIRKLEPQVKARILEMQSGKGLLERVKERLTGRVRRIETDQGIIQWLRKVASVGRRRSILKDEGRAERFEIPKTGKPQEFEVVGIPLKRTGLHVVEIESRILGKSLLGGEAPLYAPTAALVTNLAVHLKRGRESSLVWVTTLDKANPVEGASVVIRNCKADVLWKGKTDENGIAMIKKPLTSRADLPRCPMKGDKDLHFDYPQLRALGGLDSGLFVFARTSDDMAFVHSSWNQGIEQWRFRLPYLSYRGPIIAHTVLDRPLFRAGETVQMKHFFRKHTSKGFSLLPTEALPEAVSIRHQGSYQTYEFPLTWDHQSGVAETSWSIPKEAKLGHYEVLLLEKASKKGTRPTYFHGPYWRSGRFRVEEFRVPLLRAMVQPVSKPLVNVSEVDLDLLVTYLSGGGAEGLPVRLRARLQPKSVSFKDRDRFTFARGAVKEGMAERIAPSPAATWKLTAQDLLLQKGGALRTRIPGIPNISRPHDILTELEFKDPNGEIQSVSRKIPIWPSNTVLGIRPDSWALSKDQLKFHVIALDLSGKPMPGLPITVDLLRRTWYSHRKRLLGGFYSYEHITETKRVGRIAAGKTDANGLLICDVKSPLSGNIILEARAMDSAGNAAVTHTTVWVAGKADWWFDVSDHDRIDLIPEKKRYEPGETAKFQVRMPFRSAKALVTIEREGILDVHIRDLSGKQPVLELPIKESYAPNIYVSALCVRGRISGPKPTATLDLGKPAYKLGITGIKVGWEAHELKVKVTTPKDVYRIREKVPVTIKAARANGNSLPEGAEVAVAAVDEGLLELLPNNSWQLLEKMMKNRGYEVETATAQMLVVGKRHFGLKALPSGGGGGRRITRELFNTLLFWKGRIPLDKNGEATVEVPLNDALTSFRIVAIGSAGKGLFGTGDTRIRTTQELQLLSGLSRLVRNGDRFRAEFTLRNASDRDMTVQVSATMEAGTESRPFPLLTETLTSGRAKTVGWMLQVPPNVNSLKWNVQATDRVTQLTDALRVRQKVIAAVPVRISQGTLRQIKDRFHMRLKAPEAAEKGRGGVRISFKPRLADELSGITHYMKRYPYTCMEQRVSKAVALGDQGLWNRLMRELPSFLDREGFVKYFPTCRQGSDVLTAYVLAIGAEAGWTIPQGVRQRMIRGLVRLVQGKTVRYSPLSAPDLTLRKLSAMEALSRYGKMVPRFLDTLSIAPNLWPTSAVIDWLNILAREKRIKGRRVHMKRAEQIIRSRLHLEGTVMGFSTEKSDYLWWLMVSGDVNALKCILTLLNLPHWQQDLPRLLRGAVGRQRQGRWRTTVANAWGVLALGKFSKKYEAVPVKGTSTAALEGSEKSFDWSRSPGGGTLGFAWPQGSASLWVSHQGPGKPWATIQSLAAVPLKKPISNGYGITKTLVPVRQRHQGKWSVGDVIKVKLALVAQADMTWVAIRDPIPAGSSILGTGLGRDSKILTTGQKRERWIWPVFEERSFEDFRAYYEYLPKGTWNLEYTVRLNTHGAFLLPQTRIEALYSPEMFGEVPNTKFEIHH